MKQTHQAGEFELKNMICEIGKRVWTKGFVAANDGNISVKLNDKEVLTTPTGVSKGFMTPDMIIKIDRQGNMLSGNSKYRPTSETQMHLEIYNERPDVGSVLHSHPPYCTSFAVANIPLNKCVLPEAIIVIGAVLWAYRRVLAILCRFGADPAATSRIRPDRCFGSPFFAFPPRVAASVRKAFRPGAFER